MSVVEVIQLFDYNFLIIRLNNLHIHKSRLKSNNPQLKTHICLWILKDENLSYLAIFSNVNAVFCSHRV